MKRSLMATILLVAIFAISFSLPVNAVVLSSKEYSMYFYHNGVAIDAYTGGDTVVEIPAQYKGKKVYLIDDYAFSNNKNIISVSIPDSVTKLGDRVFEKCYSLKSCYLSDSIRQIGKYLFKGCINLEEVVLGAGITQMPPSMFVGCKNLHSVVIPPEIQTISSNCFSDCDSTLTIYGYSSSYAQTYAQENGFEFVALDTVESELTNEAQDYNEGEETSNIESTSESDAFETNDTGTSESSNIIQTPSAVKKTEKKEKQKNQVSNVSVNSTQSQKEPVEKSSLTFLTLPKYIWIIISAIVLIVAVCVCSIIL